MPLKVYPSGTEKLVTGAGVITPNGEKAALRIEVMTVSGWKIAAQFAPPISLACSPAETFDNSPYNPVQSQFVTAVVTGGRGPFTYAWEQISGNPASIMSTSNATTNFAANISGYYPEYFGFRCTVTDSIGQTATAVCSVSLSLSEFL